jgi:hypothetical protein
MRKNTASQVVGAQMVNAETGAAFTGSVTCYVTGDGGTQALGSVGSGACVHEGNGFHTYAPAQAETNYDHVAFTFIGTGAVPASMQVYTRIMSVAQETALARGATGLILGACEAASTTTNVVTDLAETTNDHYNGRVITFTSGALLGQSRTITDYVGSTGALTVVTLTEAPAEGDAFVIS